MNRRGQLPAWTTGPKISGPSDWLPAETWISRMSSAQEEIRRLRGELAVRWKPFAGISGEAAADLRRRIEAFCDPAAAPATVQPLSGLIARQLDDLTGETPRDPDRFRSEAFTCATRYLVEHAHPLDAAGPVPATPTHRLGRLRSRWLANQPAGESARDELDAEWVSLRNTFTRQAVGGRPDQLFDEWAATYRQAKAGTRPVVCRVDAPRTADTTCSVDLRRLVIVDGLRAEDSGVGIGIYPETAARWLERDRRAYPSTLADWRILEGGEHVDLRLGGRVTVLDDVPSGLDDDQWQFALTLHTEAARRDRNPGPYRDLAAAIDAASRA